MGLNILIVGVGGQGTLLASKVLGQYAVNVGNDVKLSEVHGMSQRGGSVITYVRMGDKIFSPVIDEGNADIVLAFEKLEAARFAHFVKPNGKIVCTEHEIYPMSVISGQRDYPNDLKMQMERFTKDITFVPAFDLALKVGNVKTVNVIMIGALTNLLNLDYNEMKKALEMSVPEKLREVNIKALDEGYNFAK